MNEHKQTDQCGFDRNASISEDTYVCTCGWRSSEPSEKVSETPRTDALDDIIFSLKDEGVRYTKMRLHACDLERELSAANARAEAAERNEERYLWLRHASFKNGMLDNVSADFWSELGDDLDEDFDERIDRAMAATNNCTKP